MVIWDKMSHNATEKPYSLELANPEQPVKPVLRARSGLGKSRADNYFQTRCIKSQGFYNPQVPFFQNTSPSHHNKSCCAARNRHTQSIQTITFKLQIMKHS